MKLRRFISIPIVWLITIFCYGLAPLWIVVSFALSAFPSLTTLPRAYGFALGFLYYENVGLLRLLWVWLRYRDPAQAHQQNQTVQYWWARGLLEIGLRLFQVPVEVSGAEALKGPAVLLIPRHTSVADTVLPMVYFAEARNEGLRYVIKKELTVLPCLDIAGHRLPNLFIDRSGIDTEGELAALRRLTSEAAEDESVLIYPEGTRFTPSKQAALKQKSADLAQQIERWPSLLPPRLKGIGAMLAANPGKDVLFMAHTGFEGSANLRDLANGTWRQQTVRMHFWRIPFAEIARDHEKFVFEQWDEMQRQVDRLNAMSAQPTSNQ